MDFQMLIIKVGQVVKQTEVEHIALCSQTPYSLAKEIIRPWYHTGLIYDQKVRGVGKIRHDLFGLKLG